jgi:hypothetical protein
MSVFPSPPPGRNRPEGAEIAGSSTMSGSLVIACVMLGILCGVLIGYRCGFDEGRSDGRSEGLELRARAERDLETMRGLISPAGGL